MEEPEHLTAAVRPAKPLDTIIHLLFAFFLPAGILGPLFLLCRCVRQPSRKAGYFHTHTHREGDSRPVIFFLKVADLLSLCSCSLLNAHCSPLVLLL